MPPLSPQASSVLFYVRVPCCFFMRSLCLSYLCLFPCSPSIFSTSCYRPPSPPPASTTTIFSSSYPPLPLSFYLSHSRSTLTAADDWSRFSRFALSCYLVGNVYAHTTGMCPPPNVWDCAYTFTSKLFHSLVYIWTDLRRTVLKWDLILIRKSNCEASVELDVHDLHSLQVTVLRSCSEKKKKKKKTETMQRVINQSVTNHFWDSFLKIIYWNIMIDKDGEWWWRFKSLSLVTDGRRKAWQKEGRRRKLYWCRLYSAALCQSP